MWLEQPVGFFHIKQKGIWETEISTKEHGYLQKNQAATMRKKWHFIDKMHLPKDKQQPAVYITAIIDAKPQIHPRARYMISAACGTIDVYGSQTLGLCIG